MSTDDTDWAALGLLDGVAPEGHGARVRLLDRLLRGGYRIDELQAAAADGTLTALPTLLLLGGPSRLSARESAAKAGLDLGFVLDVRRANGVAVTDPDVPALSEADQAVGALTRAATDAGVSAEQVLGAARVMGHALRQVADQFSEIVSDLSYDPELDEAELADRFAAQVAALQPLIDQLITLGLRVHFREAVRDAAVAAAERSGRGHLGTRDIAVGFADLVGFTRLGEELPPEQLERVASRLAELAATAADPPVRVVKTIGDAVMIVAPEPAALLDTMLRLVDLADAEGSGFPQVRVGVAAGPAITRGGDWFGSPVNLASRLSAIARAGSVLTTEAIRETTGDRFHWSAAGTRRIRGVHGAVPVFRVRAAGYVPDEA